MSYCKIVKGTEFTNKYSNAIDVYRVVYYVLDINKTVHGIIGSNKIMCCKELNVYPQFVANQFLTIQSDMSGCSRRLYHVIISFDEEESEELKLSQIRNIAELVIGLYPDYQSIYALHENKEHAHLHILFNNIPIDDSIRKLSNAMFINRIENVVDDFIGFERGL